jgi:hypothetical protein
MEDQPAIKSTTYLKTKSIKSKKVPDSTFQMPKGYKEGSAAASALANAASSMKSLPKGVDPEAAAKIKQMMADPKFKKMMEQQRKKMRQGK